MNALRLKTWSPYAVGAALGLFGAIGVYAMHERGLVRLEVKPAAFGAFLFGIGISIFGLCPGTSVAGCGEGRRDAMVGVLGMLFGAGAYVVARKAATAHQTIRRSRQGDAARTHPCLAVVLDRPTRGGDSARVYHRGWRHHHPRRRPVQQPAWESP